MTRERSKAKSYVTLFKLALAPWIIHFKSPGYIRESTMDLLDSSVCRQILELTAKKSEVRHALGVESAIWNELGQLFRAAIPSLEKRCFATSSAASPDYDGASGALMAFHSASLLKDLQRLNELVSIARNNLTIGEAAQNMAAKCLFDQEIFALMNACVKVTARGFDGDAGSAEEQKWQSVVNACKKQLITCLQFLNNLIAQNERRKLMLWVELFDSSSNEPLVQDWAEPESSGATSERSNEHRKSAAARRNNGSISVEDDVARSSGEKKDSEQRTRPPTSASELFTMGMRSRIREDIGPKATASDVERECNKKWEGLSEADKKGWQTLFTELDAKFREGGIYQLPKQKKDIEDAFSRLNIDPNVKVQAVSTIQVPSDEPESSKNKASVLLKDIHHYIPIAVGMSDPPPVRDSDFRMAHTAADGAVELQKGKDSLIKHINHCEHPAVADKATSPPAQGAPPVSNARNEPDNGAGPESEDDDSDDDDYVAPGDEGRGLLTDIPLILGPSEIEVLPMIIMSGMVPSPSNRLHGKKVDAEEAKAIVNMHAVRCHLFLAQDHGRNLLRELLIFVAAWDLREEELYFKFMMKIMEAILQNGLMPFAYHAFRESKDIISPAQAVVIKLLTHIFRVRQTATSLQSNPVGAALGIPKTLAYPWKVDVHIVNYLLTQFRQHIIPQTCALIFLQGQIAAGHAQPEEFPLNLWDMERMYEGVYQYLEYFAILTEHDAWKDMMTDWEIASELVTLLRELDIAIPKGRVPSSAPQGENATSNGKNSTSQTPTALQQDQSQAAQTPISVERPYEVGASGVSDEPPKQADPVVPESIPYPEESQDEPSEFEWRNLKKLVVLVLSSLIWKSRGVQDQVRKYGGIEAILACCTYDEHNPYIREHAIMCLRFLMEGNRENQEVIRQLEAREVVPSEVLDQHGYETFMDSKGQVGLRRKQPSRTAPTKAQAKPQTHTELAKALTNLPDWMQQLVKNAPSRLPTTKSDPDKASVMGELDKKSDETPNVEPDD